MFGWLRSKTACPVDPAMREWVDTRWAWLEGQFGPERLRKARVVLPRPEFFPDPLLSFADAGALGGVPAQPWANPEQETQAYPPPKDD